MQNIATPRLVLRPFEPADLPLLVQLYSEPATMQYITGEPRTYAQTVERFEHYRADQARYGFGLWAAVLKPSGPVIGRAGIAPTPRAGGLEGELAWVLLPDYRGQGLATESAQAWVEVAWHSLAITRLFATTDQRNAASIRVMERLGMQFVREYDRSATSRGVEYELWRPTA